jgi:two-component system, NarL family, nitrate/nitrite response regulator NarL
MRLSPGCCDPDCVALRVLLVDDSEQFLRAATSSLSRNGVKVIGAATSSATAREQIRRLEPDVVLVDVGLGDENGFELVVALVHAFPYLESRVALISSRAKDDYIELVDASPALGFISKSDLSASAITQLFSAESS